MTAYIQAIGTAVPAHDVHQPFLDWARARFDDPRRLKLFDRMAARSAIAHRWSVLPETADGGSPIGPGGFYGDPVLPGTAARMAVYADAAPALALAAIADLGTRADLGGITHLVLASCTGFVAPGVDQIVARRLGLAPSVERLLVGFMGCYAAIAALRTARHLVRSEPQARVLVVCVELCTLHMQDTPEVESLLAQLQFGDNFASQFAGVGAHFFRSTHGAIGLVITKACFFGGRHHGFRVHRNTGSAHGSMYFVREQFANRHGDQSVMAKPAIVPAALAGVICRAVSEVMPEMIMPG